MFMATIVTRWQFANASSGRRTFPRQDKVISSSCEMQKFRQVRIAPIKSFDYNRNFRMPAKREMRNGWF